MSKRILLVEDNIKIQYFNRDMLEEEGFIVQTAMSLAAAKEAIAHEMPDLMVLDIGMPDGSGLEFLRGLRRESNLPVLMLSGYHRDADVVSGFDAGCDDYLAKPYSFEVLLARIKRLLRAAQQLPQSLQRGEIYLDLTAGRAYVSGVDCLLTPKDFALLRLLMQREGGEISTEEIYRVVWGRPTNDDTRALVVALSRLRKKLVGSGYGIVSVYGGGYILKAL